MRDTQILFEKVHCFFLVSKICCVLTSFRERLSRLKNVLHLFPRESLEGVPSLSSS